MSNTAQQHDTGSPHDPGFGELIVRYLDGLIDDDESTRLVQQLEGSDDAVAMMLTLSVQRRMLRESLQHSALRLQIQHVSAASNERCLAGPNPTRRRWIGSLVAAAAAVALCVGIWSAWTPSIQPSAAPMAELGTHRIGIITAVHNVQWGKYGEPMIAGQALNTRSVSLNSGSIQLVTNAGVALTIDGPGEFEMVDPMHAVVRRGTIVAEAPTGVTGFTIQTARLRARDLGTEFGVHVDPAGVVDLEVLDGRVEVTTLDATGRTVAQRVLTRWQSVRFDAARGEELADVSPSDSYFADRRVMRDGFPGLSRHGRSADPIRLDVMSFQPYANQDGYNNKSTAIALRNDGAVCRLSGNCWKSIPVDYEVTEKTVLEVEFRTIQAGEIIGVGIDDDDNVKTGETLFALAGNHYDAPGVNADYHQPASGDWQTVRIQPGDRTRGPIRQLVLFADDDAAGRAVGEFRNLRLYESAPETDSEHPAGPSETDATGHTVR